MSESNVKRHFPAEEFGHTKVQLCMKPECHGVLIIEGKYHQQFFQQPDGKIRMRRHDDPGLREGDIWGCKVCGTLHEFYLEYISGPGGALKLGTVRVYLPGESTERDKGEPTPGEFVV